MPLKSLIHEIAGAPRTGVSLERPDPCEGKLARTVRSPHLLFAIATILCCALAFAYQARASTNAVSQLDRTIIKEPAYQTTPKYSLMTLGNSGHVRVWMVEDGRRLFVDKNTNGDLTDDGPAIEPSKVSSQSTTFWNFVYLLNA